MSKLVMNIKNEQNLKAMIEWCKQYHIEYDVLEDTPQTSVPTLVDDTTSAHTTTLAPKVYEHTSEDFDNFMFVVRDNKVTYTHKDGTYLHEKAVRNVLNARIKACGGNYVDKCWEFNKGDKRDIKGAKQFVANNSGVVTASEINAIRDKWTEKSAKRAKKAN